MKEKVLNEVLAIAAAVGRLRVLLRLQSPVVLEMEIAELSRDIEDASVKLAQEIFGGETSPNQATLDRLRMVRDHLEDEIKEVTVTLLK